jgi:hypothetical protein
LISCLKERLRWKENTEEHNRPYQDLHWLSPEGCH